MYYVRNSINICGIYIHGCCKQQKLKRSPNSVPSQHKIGASTAASPESRARCPQNLISSIFARRPDNAQMTARPPLMNERDSSFLSPQLRQIELGARPSATSQALAPHRACSESERTSMGKARTMEDVKAMMGRRLSLPIQKALSFRLNRKSNSFRVRG